MKISKSDYVLGIKCPNALWFKKFRPDIEREEDQRRLDNGTMVGKLACDRFPGGVRITAKPWEDEAVVQTQSAMSANASFIYEATFATDSGEYCAVDILRNNNDGTWDIIEVKSATEPHEYHYFDVSFQKYVLVQCGINVRNCFIMTLNKNYVRHGDLDLVQLFALHDADEQMQSMNIVQQEIARLRAVLDGPELGIALSKPKCENKFYRCGYCHHCWRNIPDFSVFDAFRSPISDKLCAEYGPDLKNIPAELYVKQKNRGDIEAFLNNINTVNRDILRDFTKRLRWPLYFLDYETIQSPIPMFDNSRPDQQICFQFSLHVQNTPGDVLIHYGYLHQEPGTDPRPKLLKALNNMIGDTGSVIVYNKTFECTCNRDMASGFPEYAEKLLSINERIVDLMEPFKKRGLYCPRQNGSVSIKKTLPAFVPEMSYENLGIHNGTEASCQFLDFMNGKLTVPETKEMMLNLHEYCGQDTLAMVRLLDVIQTIIKE